MNRSGRRMLRKFDVHPRTPPPPFCWMPEPTTLPADRVPTAPLETADAVVPRPGLAAAALAVREFVRFIRQPNRVVGAIGQPVLFWLFFGAGFHQSLHVPGAGQQNYLEYYFPGTLVLILLFTAIFTTISVIEDRREGFLQSVLVSPIPRWAMVLGKLAGGTAIAVAQGVLFLALALTIGVVPPWWAWLGLLGFLTVTALALTGLGFVLAWRMDSVQGFHAVMSLFLLPLWLLSGALFPNPAGWLAAITTANPLTYSVAGVRRLLYAGAPDSLPADLPSLSLCAAVTAVFAVVTFAASCKVAGTRTTGDLL